MERGSSLRKGFSASSFGVGAGGGLDEMGAELSRYF